MFPATTKLLFVVNEPVTDQSWLTPVLEIVFSPNNNAEEVTALNWTFEEEVTVCGIEISWDTASEPSNASPSLVSVTPNPAVN